MQVNFKCPFCKKQLAQYGMLVVECQCPESIQQRYLSSQQPKLAALTWRELRERRKGEKGVK